MDGLKGLKCGEVYEIDYNTKGFPKDIILVLDTFIAKKHHKSIGIRVINQSYDAVWIPWGQHIGTIHLVEGRIPSEEEFSEIIHQFKVQKQ